MKASCLWALGTRAQCPAQLRAFLLPISLVALVLCTSASLHAQWEIRAQVGPANFVKMMDEIGSPEIGYIGLAGPGLRRTNDTGYTWNDVQMNGHGGEVMRDVAFKPDGLTGWACSSLGAYVTTDGGMHWERCFSGTCTSVAYMSAVNAVVLGCRSANSSISYDDGKTWVGYASGGLNGLTNLDDQRYYCSAFSAPAVFTTNAGADWHTSDQSLEVWQPVALKNRGWYLSVSEKTNQVLRSYDNGFSWVPVDTLAVQPTGCVRGTEENLIIQTKKGMMRSTDLGETWEDLCGPDLGVDTRFWVRGTEIFAISLSGLLMYNPTSQTGGLEAYVINPTPLSLATDGCATTNGSVRITTSTCGAILVSAQLTGPPEFTRGVLKLPLTFGPSVDIPISYKHINPGNDTATLAIQLDLDGTIIDSVIPIYGEKLKILLGKMTPEAVELEIDESCDGSEAPITVTNPTCDPFTIDSARLTDAHNFEITGITFPHVVAGKSYFTFMAHAKNATDPKHEAELDVFISNTAGRMVLTDTLELERHGKIEHGRLEEQRHEFNTSCIPLNDALRFHNTYCDTIFVDSVIFSDAIHFQPAKLSLPFALPRDSDLMIPYVAIPPKPGPASSKVRLVYRSGNTPTQQITYLLSSSRIDLQLPDDTVRFAASPECPTFDSTIEIRNVLCDPITVLSLKPAIQPDYTITLPSLPVTLDADASLAIGVSSKLLTKGQTSTYIRMSFECYGEVHDTTLYITLSRAAAFDIRPDLPKVAFDRTSICAPRRRTVPLENNYCVDITIDKLQWSSSSSSQFKTIYQPTLPRHLTPGERDSVVIEFAPTQTGLRNGAMELTLSSAYGNTQTFFSVDGIGTGSVNASIADAKLAMGTALTCKKLRAQTIVSNDGCEGLDLMSVTPSGGPFVLLSPTIPYYLKPGDSVVLIFETAATTPGLYTQSVRARLVSSTNIEQLLDCELSAVFEKETQRLEFTAFDAGEHSECHPIDTVITITNPSTCDALNVAGAFLTTDAIIIGSNTATIDPGASANFRFSITPNKNNSVTLRLFGGDIDTTLRIDYSFVAGGGSLTLDVPGEVFETNACDALTKSVTIGNTSCTPLSVSNIQLQPAGGTASKFALVGQMNYPLEIAANDKLTFEVRYDPTASGVDNALLVATPTTGAVLTGTLTGNSISPQTLSASLASGGMQEVIVGDTLQVDLLMKSAVTSPVAIEELLAQFAYDTDMLTLMHVHPRMDWSVSSQNDIAQGTSLTLAHAASAYAIGDTIASLVFRSTLSRDRSGTITLQDLKLNPATPDFTRCVANLAFSPSASDVSLRYFCGGETLRSALAGELPIRKINVRPQPASSADQALVVTFEAAIECDVKVELVNVLGMTSSNAIVHTRLGENELHLPISSLSSGWHLLRLRCDAGTAGVRVLIAN